MTSPSTEPPSTSAPPVTTAPPDPNDPFRMASNNHLTRLPALAAGHIIAGGHCIAAAALMTMCIAAAQNDGSKLPRYASVFFALSFAVRLVLFRERLAKTKPYSPSGVEMSLGAAALFVSNAAASVATLTRVDLVLVLTAFSALDVTARWLNMVASAKTPSLPRFKPALLALDVAADAYICALVADEHLVERYAFPAFVMKIIYNVVLMYLSAKVVVDRDTKKRDDSKDE